MTEKNNLSEGLHELIRDVKNIKLDGRTKEKGYYKSDLIDMLILLELGKHRHMKDKGLDDLDQDILEELRTHYMKSFRKEQLANMVVELILKKMNKNKRKAPSKKDEEEVSSDESTDESTDVSDEEETEEEEVEETEEEEEEEETEEEEEEEEPLVNEESSFGFEVIQGFDDEEEDEEEARIHAVLPKTKSKSEVLDELNRRFGIAFTR